MLGPHRCPQSPGGAPSKLPAPKAERHEEVERQNGVSEAEMAARYAKYLPAGFNQQPAAPMPEPPVVANPVRVRDAPVGGFDGGNKAKKKKVAL